MPKRTPTRATCIALPRYKGSATITQLVAGLRRHLVFGDSIRQSAEYVNGQSAKLAKTRLLSRKLLRGYVGRLPDELKTAAAATEIALFNFVQQTQVAARAEVHFTKKRLLTDLEESLLTQWIAVMAQCNHPVTKADLIVHVRAQLLARPSLTDEERHHFATSHLTSWCRGYLKRNSGLRQRFAQHAKPARLITEGNFENVDHIFDILEKYKHLPPEQVLAGDETGLHGDGALRSRVLVPVGMKRVKTPKSRTQTHIGVMHIGSAKGDTLPPVVVFKGAWTYNHHVDALPKDALIGMQENGHFIGLHMIQVLQHIVKHAVAARPLLFIVDGASSHIDWDAILYAQKELIDILCLPANMTHKLQVADVALFGPFKRYWRQACEAKRKEVQAAGETGWALTSADLVPAIMSAWEQAMRPESVVAGFRRTGMFPIDRDVWKQDFDLAEKAVLDGLPLVVTPKALITEAETFSELARGHSNAVPDPVAAVPKAKASAGPKLCMAAGMMLCAGEAAALIHAKKLEKEAKAQARQRRKQSERPRKRARPLQLQRATTGLSG